MSSFQQKLQSFLAQARQEQLIDEQLLMNLSTFAQQQDEHRSLLARLSFFAYIAGALLAILGTILFISYNWNGIPNLLKLISYLGLLAGITLIALYITNQTLANTLLLINSGLVLVGIGLIAQIYNLSSDAGSAFFIWWLLILPTTIFLNWKWLNLMAIYAFYQWLIQYLNYSGAVELVCIPILLGTALIFLKLDHSNQYPLLTKFIYLMDIVFYYCMLLLQNGSLRKTDSPLQLHLLYIMLILLAAVSTGYLIRRQQQHPLPFLYIWLSSAIPLFLAYVPRWFYILFINSMWIFIPVALIIRGVQQIQPKLVNLGVALLIIYIITQFSYYFDSILSSGMIFLIIGVGVIFLAVQLQQLHQRLTTYSRPADESKN